MSDVITNRDAAYLKAHADIEHEAELSDIPAEMVEEAALYSLTVAPEMTARQIGEICRAFTTETGTVHCRIESINGRTVGVFVRTRRAAPDVATSARLARECPECNGSGLALYPSRSGEYVARDCETCAEHRAVIDKEEGR